MTLVAASPSKRQFRQTSVQTNLWQETAGNRDKVTFSFIENCNGQHTLTVTSGLYQSTWKLSQDDKPSWQAHMWQQATEHSMLFSLQPCVQSATVVANLHKPGYKHPPAGHHSVAAGFEGPTSRPIDDLPFTMQSMPLSVSSRMHRSDAVCCVI